MMTDDGQVGIWKKNKETFVAYFKVGLIFRHTLRRTLCSLILNI
jgi:hypothetical protein